ncbi:MAG: hypothetical protein ABIY62_06815 [Ginsengibacter sp.]
MNKAKKIQLNLSYFLKPFFLFFIAFSNSAKAQESIYPAPLGAKPSADYGVSVDGRSVFIYATNTGILLRMFWDYGVGLMTDWGVHLIDMALWAKDITSGPLAAASSGGNFAYPDHAHETFDTMAVTYQMSDHEITWGNTGGIQSGPWGRNYGLAFVGNDATIVIDRSSWDLIPEMDNGKYKVAAMPQQPGHDSHEAHVKNWIECLKSRKDPQCPIETGRLAALYSHIGNISLRTQSRIVWDETNKNFGNNTAANNLLMPAYRKPWTLPKL